MYKISLLSTHKVDLVYSYTGDFCHSDMPFTQGIWISFFTTLLRYGLMVPHGGWVIVPSGCFGPNSAKYLFLEFTARELQCARDIGPCEKAITQNELFA